MSTLSTTAIENVTSAIATELLKRGFLAKLSATVKETRTGGEYLEITSEPFQTVPVIMSEIKISASISIFTQTDGKVGVNGGVGVAYSHFTGGTNGCELFRFGSHVNEYGELFGMQVR